MGNLFFDLVHIYMILQVTGTPIKNSSVRENILSFL